MRRYIRITLKLWAAVIALGLFFSFAVMFAFTVGYRDGQLDAQEQHIHYNLPPMPEAWE